MTKFLRCNKKGCDAYLIVDQPGTPEEEVMEANGWKRLPPIPQVDFTQDPPKEKSRVVDLCPTHVKQHSQLMIHVTNDWLDNIVTASQETYRQKIIKNLEEAKAEMGAKGEAEEPLEEIPE